MRVLSNVEMSWIAGGWDSVDEITVEAPSDGGGGSDDGNWDDPGGDDGNDYDEGGSGSGGGGGVASEIAGAAADIVKALAAVPWNSVLINLNEEKLALLGGYHEKIDMNQLTPLWKEGSVGLYGNTQGNIYGDRDGDGRIDTGILYNPDTRVISADFDCDGVGDQFIAQLR